MFGDQLGTRSGRTKIPREKSAESGPEGRDLECYILFRGEERTDCPSTGCTDALEVAVTILLASCLAQIELQLQKRQDSCWICR